MKPIHVALLCFAVLLIAVGVVDAGPYQSLPGRRGTFAMPTGTILPGSVLDATATVTGAQAGADCFPTGPENMDSGLVFQSATVTASDTVRVRIRSEATLSLESPAGTGSVRCFNP